MLALILGVIVLAGVAEVWMVYALAVALGAVTALDNPGRRAFVPEMVPALDVANAVGLNSTVFTAARVVGPAVAGIVIAGFGVSWCFFLNAASFVAVIWALAAMRPSELRVATPVPRARHQLREGLQYSWHNRPVRLALLLTAVVGTFAFNYQVVLPLLAEREFGGNAATFGFMMAILGIGSLSGALWIAHFGRASMRIMVGSVVAVGVTMSAAAVAPTLGTELAVLPFVGLASMIAICMATAVCNEETAPEYRGRVMALLGVAFLGSTPIGGPFVGWVSQDFGPRAGLAVGAIAALIAGVAALGRRQRARAGVAGVEHADLALPRDTAAA